MALSKSAATLLFDAGLGLSLAVSLGVITLVDSKRTPSPEAGKYERREDLLGGSIYFLRSQPNKETLVVKLGGTRETEGAVRAGLDWIARHQAADGSWSNDCLGLKSPGRPSRCEGPEPCFVPGLDYSMAQTGLSLLALQAAGNYDFNKNKYSDQVRRGLYWLIDHQRPETGALVGPDSSQANQYRITFMYEHAIATFALAEACAVRKAQGEPADRRLLDATVKAVRFIEASQHDDGGWRYSTTKTEGGDTSVSGWAMLALKSAVEAGIPLDPKTIPRTRDFFAACTTPEYRTRYTAGSGPGSDALTAVGMLTHLLLLKDPTSPLVSQSASYLAGQAESHRDHVRAGQAEFYTLYNVTLAMQQAGGANWDRWNGAVRDAVVANQCRGTGCNRGSWDPGGTQGGNIGGRIYSTALGTLMLEVYYRFSRKDH